MNNEAKMDAAHRQRLERLEAALIEVRNAVAGALRAGDGKPAAIERRLGTLIVVLTEMDEAGEISQQAAYAVAMALAAERRGEIAGTRH